MTSRSLGRLFLAFLGVQVVILVFQHETFFSELFRFPSRLAHGVPEGAGSSVPLLLAALAAAALWARRAGPRRDDVFAVAGLATLAFAGLAVYGAGLATGRLAPGVPWAAVAVSAALATAGAPRTTSAGEAPSAPWSVFDLATSLFFATLLVPTVFPYVAYDAERIWAARAYLLRDAGFAAASRGGVRPEYPPLDSLFLGFGIRDPLFEGRLLPWLLLFLFAVFFRARLARVSARLAPAALLFLVATVHVWQGIATFYADVPLMIFAVAGSLLVLGLPGAGPASAFERAAGALCLMAAALLRPDGLICLGVVACAVLLRARPRARGALAPAALALLAFLSWTFRPAPLQPLPGAYRTLSHAGEWREAGDTALAAFTETVLTYLHALQGQWLSHKGLGGAFWLGCVVAFERRRTRDAPRAPAREVETRFYGAATFLSLLAVAATYAAIPFVSDVRGAIVLDDFPTWISAFRNFARVGMGRMVVHLLPFFVLYAVSELAARREGETRTAPC